MANKFSADWFMKGILTRTGEAFDRLTGRNWKASSLAASELAEKIRRLLDLEVRDLGAGGRFAPHRISLKMQWDKFAAESERSIEKLKNELHAAAVDHINDRRYYTYAPLTLDISEDYFTDGVKLSASFETLGAAEPERSVNLSIPLIPGGDLVSASVNKHESRGQVFTAIFNVKGLTLERRIEFFPGDRKSVGRSGQNDLVIDDISITNQSHATLVLNPQNELMVADTGSTNGTFLNGQRISNGRALAVGPGDILTFGSVEVEFKHVPAAEPAGKSPRPGETAANGSGRQGGLTSTPPAEARGESLESDDSGPLSAPETVAGKADEAESNNPTREGIILDFSDDQK